MYIHYVQSWIFSNGLFFTVEGNFLLRSVVILDEILVTEMFLSEVFFFNKTLYFIFCHDICTYIHR
jgi:hypothetical protein